MQPSIKVNYQKTETAYIAQQWLNSLPDLFAADFEVAIKYTTQEIAEFKEQLKLSTNKAEQIRLQSIINADPLGLPQHCVITHLSVAWSESDSYVFVLTNEAITRVVLRFLTTTTKKQVWHNAGYDFRQLLYHSGKVPLNYEDTQILAKTLMNHVESYKADTGLKSLAGQWYGSWGISADNFTIEQIRDINNIKYAATDACATYKLWTELQLFIKES